MDTKQENNQTNPTEPASSMIVDSGPSSTISPQTQHDVATWTVERVVKWAKSVLKKYECPEEFADKLKDQYVNGASLIQIAKTFSDPKDLIQELKTYGIPGAPAANLAGAIKQLVSGPSVTPQQEFSLEGVLQTIKGVSLVPSTPASAAWSRRLWVDRPQIKKDVLNFYRGNIDAFEKRGDRTQHSFLYCINGSGWGKTWTGRYFCNKLVKTHPRRAFDILLDFHNGDSTTYDTHVLDASIALGLRVAARYFLNKNVGHLLHMLAKQNVPSELFSFPEVMEIIVKHRECTDERPFLFAIQFDELQLAQHPRGQQMLHVVGEYMVARKHPVVVFPVITATSQANFRREVTGYGVILVTADVFNLKSSIQLLRSRKCCSEEQLESKEVQKLALCCGGLPRILNYLATEMKKARSIQADQIVENLKVSLGKWYKFDQGTFGSKDLVHKILAYSIIRKPVNLSDESPVKGSSWHSLMENGTIYVQPLSENSSLSRVVVPPIVASLLSTIHYLFELDILLPVKSEWSWKKFEEVEPLIEMTKNNLLIAAEITTTTLSQFYGDLCSAGVKEKTCTFQNLEFSRELRQTLPVPEGDLLKLSFETDKGIISYKEDERLFNFSFLSCAGNPSVDSRVFRKPHEADPDRRPWLFVKQTKHTVSENSYLSLSYMEEQYRNWQLLRAPFEKYFRIPYILFTNKNSSIEDIEAFTGKHSGVFVVCHANLFQYAPSAFSAFAFFDDVEQTFKEDFLKGGYKEDSTEDMDVDEDGHTSDDDYQDDTQMDDLHG